MGLKGYRLWVMGKLDSTCRAPPLHRQRQYRLLLVFVLQHASSLDVAVYKLRLKEKKKA
jgi:hypothetical protein